MVATPTKAELFIDWYGTTKQEQACSVLEFARTLAAVSVEQLRTKFRKDITHRNCIARWARQFEAGVVCQETFGRPHMYFEKRRVNEDQPLLSSEQDRWTPCDFVVGFIKASVYYPRVPQNL